MVSPCPLASLFPAVALRRLQGAGDPGSGGAWCTGTQGRVFC